MKLLKVYNLLDRKVEVVIAENIPDDQIDKVISELNMLRDNTNIKYSKRD